MNKEIKSVAPSNADIKDINTTPEAYETPELTVYGGIAELIKNNPGAGTDGGFPGCTRT